MANIATGRQALNALADALGLSLNCNRVVIDLPCDGVARVIRVDYLTEEQAAALAESLKGINAEVV
jgi:hypothetical protein